MGGIKKVNTYHGIPELDIDLFTLFGLIVKISQFDDKTVAYPKTEGYIKFQIWDCFFDFFGFFGFFFAFGSTETCSFNYIDSKEHLKWYGFRVLPMSWECLYVCRCEVNCNWCSLESLMVHFVILKHSSILYSAVLRALQISKVNSSTCRNWFPFSSSFSFIQLNT